MQAIVKENPYLKIIKNGLWTNNQALVAMLGLCPLLAVSNNAVNALGLGIATIFVLVISNLSISVFRSFINDEVRIPIFVLIIASLVSIVEILMQALFYDLFLILGIFVPLIVTNCVILGRAEAYAAKNSYGKATLDGLSMGAGFALVLFVLGAVREILSSGALFVNSDILFKTDFSIKLFDFNILLFATPAGAFIVLGLLVALKQFITK
jgi:electron transport complex protein RnfE